MKEFIDHSRLVRKVLRQNEFLILKSVPLTDSVPIAANAELIFGRNEKLFNKTLKTGECLTVVIGIKIEIHVEKERVASCETQIHAHYEAQKDFKITEKFYDDHRRYFLYTCYDDIRINIQKQFDISEYAGFRMPLDARTILQLDEI